MDSRRPPVAGHNDTARILLEFNRRLTALETLRGPFIFSRAFLGSVDPLIATLAADAVYRNIYLPTITVPDGAITANILVTCQGINSTSAAITWKLHARNSDGSTYVQLDELRQNNSAIPAVDMGGAMGGWKDVTEYGSTALQLKIEAANDATSGSVTTLVKGHYTVTFFR